MAVAPRDFYPRFKAKAVAMVLTTQLLIIGIGLSAYFLLLPDLNAASHAGVISIAIIGTLQLLTALPLINTLTEPTRLISAAVVHVSKQQNDVVPPDINQPRHQKSGLKDIVQTIYELALGSSHEIAVASAAKEELATNDGFLKGLLNDIPCGVVAMNTKGDVVFANTLAPIVVNSKQEQLLQLEFETDDTLEDWLKQCEKEKLRDTKSWARIASKLPDEPNRKIYDIVAHYEKDSSVAETILVAMDRTDEYAPAQEDMDFTALAAHELRGPITVIRGYLDVLYAEIEPSMNEDQKALYDRISVSSNRLNTYINNILNVSRYDRKHLKLHLYEEKLSEIIGEVTDDLNSRARTQNRLLSFTIPDDLPTIAADRNSVSEVINNLVDNALKYSHEGGQVIVGASVKGDFVEVTVQDFGIGIPGSITEQLFTKFYRSHRSRQNVSGTGLGLYLSKGIIESHGGKVWVHSTEGQGSTFGFTLPVYSTIADKLLKGNNSNEDIIESSSGWIKNHGMYRR